MSDLLLSRELENVFTNNQGRYLARGIRKRAEDRLLEMSHTYRNVKRDFLTIMTYAYSPKARSSAAFKRKAQQAVWSLREVPSPRFIGKGDVDLRMNPEWSVSASPRLPWKVIKGPFRLKKEPMDFNYHMQGAYMYPIFEVAAWSSIYIWKDGGFPIQDSGHNNLVFYSADYLIIYRVALSAGLISPLE